MYYFEFRSELNIFVNLKIVYRGRVFHFLLYRGRVFGKNRDFRLQGVVLCIYRGMVFCLTGVGFFRFSSTGGFNTVMTV